MILNEKELIKRLKYLPTQEDAFKQLMFEYKERLYWHIRKIVKTHANTDDVLQNTFVKVFRNIHKFKEESKLFSWMYRIATNESLTYIKKEASRKSITIEDVNYQLAKNLESDVYFNGNEIELLLQKAIAKLPQKQQLVFNMKYFDAIKYKEMSVILDTSVGALKASYHHAVKKLEVYLIKS